MKTVTAIINSSISSGQGSRIKFDISVGNQQMLLLYALYISFVIESTDLTTEIIWSLIQKNEFINNDAGVDRCFDIPANGRCLDNDIISTGVISSVISTTVNKYDYSPQNRIYAKPIKLIRSPSLQIHQQGGSSNVRIICELHYEKINAKTNDILKIMKQWTGRKQLKVANIARVIDE